MREKILIAIIFLLLTISITEAKAENSLLLNFVVAKNDSIFVNQIKVIEAGTLLPKNQGDYKLEILDNSENIVFSTNFDVKFIILSEPPIETDEALMYMRLPWDSNSVKVNFYHNEKIISEILLSGYLCNRNNQCESSLGENQINCPEDCFEGTMTTTSTMPEVTTTLPIPKPSTPIYIYLIAVGVIAVLVIFLISRIKIVK
jgi:hypothetical protein